MNRMAITRIKRQGISFLACIVLNEKRQFVDFSLTKEEESLLNNIYIGRVEEIVPGIDAAFMRIQKGQKCFLQLKELRAPVFTKKQSKNKPLCAGDELLVQVTRDAVKTKEPVVSAGLSLQGKCSVLTTANRSLSVSKKLNEKLRKQYFDLLGQLFPAGGESAEERDFGIIIRTGAGAYSLEEVKEDVLSLAARYRKMKADALHRDAFSLMYQDPPAYVAKLKTVDMSGIDSILTDQPDIMEQVKLFYPPAAVKLKLYEDEALSLDRLYQINSTIEALTSSRVWLSSGANIIIEQLETLTFIDVNSGKNQSAKPDTILKVNMEAAKEIPRQLKLRNISGMILVDFINMKSKEEEQQLILLLKEELKKDSCPCSFIDITKLGLVEMTRKKTHRSLKEILGGE